MDSINLHTIAGFLSTAVFISSTVPMLTKAFKTRDMKSYSFANITLSNVGNLVHWVYISHLPFGPIWFLHGFYTLTTLFMLVWYLRHEGIASTAAWSEMQIISRVRCAIPVLVRAPAVQECGCA
ncbi:MAG: hypothetical protein IAF02_03410 [Anaerolineae bacterium]|nr:hypothetical protein [Anaerolineae bacterium]